MSSTNGLLSLAGWYILPNLVTGYVQSALYAIFVRAGDPKPAPGSPRFVRDRRRIQIFVIVLYLLYTVYDADWELRRAGNFYQDLGVPFDATEKAIQSRFRRLTIKYHPDKVSSADRSEVEAIYVRLQLARDTLIHPAKRFAYDRFGPDILGWQQAKTLQDYVFTGFQHTAVYYLGTAGALVILSILGYFPSGKFWRFLVMVAFFLFEMQTMTRPYFPGVLTSLINPIVTITRTHPPYLPFQMLALLRKLAVTLFIAMSQLGPLLRGPQASPMPADGSVPPQLLNQLDALTNATETEVQRVLGLNLAPFAGEAKTKALAGAIKDWLVTNTVRNDPGVKAAVQRVLEQRRADSSRERDVNVGLSL